MTTPPLPPGFVLEGADQSLPPLPPGFELEQAEPALELDIVGGTPVSAAEFAQQPQPSLAEREGRGLGLGVRSAVQGVGGLVGALGGDAFNAYVVDPVRRQLHSPGLSDLVIGNAEFQPSPSFRDIAGNLADRAGLPRPQDARERVLGDVGEALSGTAATMGIGGGINALANLGRPAIAPVTNRLAQLLTSQPGYQVAGAVGGSGAGGVTRESGGSQGQQLAASLLGGLGPSALAATGAATLRGVTRGRDGAAMQRTIDDFTALGATPSVGQASGNRTIQGAENLLAGAPTSAGVMGRFAERQADDIGTGLQGMAQRLQRNPSGERAGRAIERGIHGPDGFTQRFKETQAELFDRLDQYIPSGQRVGVSSTMEAIGRLNAPIPGAPNVSRLFQNSQIRGVGQALEKDLAIPSDAQKSLDDALARVDSLYASRDSAVQDMGRFQAFANDQANRTHRFHPVEGQPRIPGRYSPFPQRVAEGVAAAEDSLSAARGNVSRAQQIEATIGDLSAAAAATSGRLPYEAVKKLRTLVGQEIDNAGLMSDFPRDKWKALYGALSDDLGMAAREAGPDAAQAYARANNYTRAGMRRVEDIQQVIDKSGGPEKIYAAVMSGTRDGGTTLRAVMQSLPPEGQRAVTAATIRRMGMATPGAQDAAGEAFSAQTFLTNWNKVSPEAKRALFDRHGPNFSRDMDRIANVAENIRNGSRVFANPSGTANRAAALTYGASLVGSMFTGGTAGLIGAGVVANGLARYMTNPRAVNWLARTTMFPRGAIPGALNAMRMEGERTGDTELLELAGELEKRVQEVPSAP